MQARFWTAALLGFVLIAASACSGGGNNARISDLEKRLQEAEETIEEATTAEAEETTTAEPVVEPTPEPVAEEVEEAEEEVAEEQPEAEEEVQQDAQTLEANHRAEKLLEVFQGSDDTALTSPTVGTTSLTSPATITVPARNNLTFKQGDRSVSKISKPSLQGARLTRTRGGSQTTVVYTNVELSRKLLDHYGSVRNTADMAVFNLGAAPLQLPADILQTSEMWSVTHGVSTSLLAVDGDTTDTDTTKDDLPAGAEDARPPRTSYPGRLHGLNGDFVCRGDGCQVQVTPDYADAAVNEKFALLSVAIAATGTASSLHFRPDRGVALQLHDDGPVGADGEYMVFGYWRDEPASALGDYDFGVFADRAGAEPASGTLIGTAEYDGTAVGMYVEQGVLGTSGVTTKQGEFTADVRLDVTFDGASPSIEGTIDGFEATPTGGSTAPTSVDTWSVKLQTNTVGASALHIGTDAARIDIRGTTSTGAWSHAFVANNSAAAPGQPPAVTGTFNTEIQDLLHIVGAYGAHKQ